MKEQNRRWWKFLVLGGLFIGYSPSHAVVNGQAVVESAENQGLRSVLALKIRYSPCTGTYLGKGRILTAAHCLLLDGYPQEKAPICVQDGFGHSLGCFQEKEYSVSFPEKEKDGPKAPVRGGTPGSSHVIRIPIPDMAMIVLNQELDVPPVALALSGKSSKPLWIAGQGCNHYETFEGREVMRIGPVELDTGADSTMDLMTWRPGSTLGGACPGDSGGPLFERAPDGQLLQVGVISYIQRKFDEKGLLSVLNVFGRIDGTSASLWLRGAVLKH